MLKVEDLVKHMQQHKDAVIILGPGAANYQSTKPPEELMKESYTHKSLVRTPEKFWDFFRQYIYISPDNNKPTAALKYVDQLNHHKLIQSVIIQPTDGIYRTNYNSQNVIELHGSSTTFHCNSCKIDYPYQYYESCSTAIPECEVCGKALRPNILLFGEKYKDDIYQAVKHHILSTHTLLLIGMDYTEDPISSLVADYCEIKNTANSFANKDDHKMAVAIGIPEGYDPNQNLGFFEFVVKDDINAAMDRLVLAHTTASKI